MEIIVFLVIIIFYQPSRYIYYKVIEIAFWYRVNRQSKSPEGFRLKGDAKYYDELLLEHIPYYRKLKPASKAKFLNRINRFIYSKKFIGKEGFEVTLDTQVLISAAAIQLTFGLKNYFFASFKKIFVYPDSFYFRQTGQYHKGNSGTQDFINLSYKHFLEGFGTRKDRINLGLHEMTHALEFNYLFGDNYDYLFADFYDSWADMEEIEFEKMVMDKDYFLRRYAKANIHEFFAVSVEHFFEDPRTFINKAPNLYYRLCTLLNQDPLNEYGDYSLAKASKEVHHIKRNFLNRRWHWSYSIILSSIFPGILFIYYIIDNMLISTPHIFLLILLSAITGAVFQYNYFKKNYWPGIIHFVGYNLIGFGIWFTFLILLLNQIIPVKDTDTSFYQIEKVYYENMDAYTTMVKVCKISNSSFEELANYYNLHPSERLNRDEIQQLAKSIPKEELKIDYTDCMEPKILLKNESNIFSRPLIISKTKGLFGFYTIKRMVLI